MECNKDGKLQLYGFPVTVELKKLFKKNLFQTRRLIMIVLMKLRELPTKKLLNKDYYRGRFAIKTSDQKSIFNWEDYS